MATNTGLSELEIVNRMLRGSGIRRVTSVPSTGPGVAYEAKQTLDDMIDSVQLDGWGEILPSLELGLDGDAPNNTITIDGTGPNATNNARVQEGLLMVRGAGRDRHRNFYLLQGQVYDADLRASTFEAGIEVDAIRKQTITQMTPAALEVLSARAVRRFQMEQRGDMERDRYFAAEVAAVEARLPPHPLVRKPDTHNVTVMGPTSAAISLGATQGG